MISGDVSGWDGQDNRTTRRREMLTESNKGGIIAVVGVILFASILAIGSISLTVRCHKRDITMAKNGWERVGEYKPKTGGFVGWKWVRVNNRIDHEGTVAFLRRELEKESVL